MEKASLEQAPSDKPNHFHEFDENCRQQALILPSNEALSHFDMSYLLFFSSSP